MAGRGRSWPLGHFQESTIFLKCLKKCSNESSKNQQQSFKHSYKNHEQSFQACPESRFWASWDPLGTILGPSWDPWSKKCLLKKHVCFGRPVGVHVGIMFVFFFTCFWFSTFLGGHVEFNLGSFGDHVGVTLGLLWRSGNRFWDSGEPKKGRGNPNARATVCISFRQAWLGNKKQMECLC